MDQILGLPPYIGPDIVDIFNWGREQGQHPKRCVFVLEMNDEVQKSSNIEENKLP
jgi:hypothetical protein